MHKMRWLLLLLLLLAACGAAAPTAEPAQDYAVPEEAAMEPAPAPGAPSGGGGTAAAELPRMIIYNAELALVVADVEAVQAEAVSLVEAVDGYVAGTSSYQAGAGLRRVTLTLRVPAESFQETLAALRALALEVTRESVGSEDVTQEYVDLESRLRALEAKAVRLEELMEQAEDTEAVLAVYEELSETQQQIEQTKGRMRYLERSAAMATLTVQLTPDALLQPVEIGGWRPQGTLRRAVEAAVRVFQFLVDALIWFVIVFLPVLVVLGGLFYLFVRLVIFIIRRLQQRSSE